MNNLCNVVYGILVWTYGPELELKLMYLINLELGVLFFPL
jgi:hypothetical protein